MTGPPTASTNMHDTGEQAIDISRLVDELTDMWSPLARHHGATLVCEVSTSISRHIVVDLEEFRDALATCMVRVLEASPPESVVHLRLHAEADSYRQLRGLRCSLTTMRTADEQGVPASSAEFSVPASTPRDDAASGAALLDGARVLVLAHSTSAGSQMTCLGGAGAEVRVTDAPGAVLGILLHAARAGDPFDLCILDASAAASVDVVVSELRSLPAFTGLPVILVAHEPRTEEALDRDDRATTCDPDADNILECAERVLTPPETAATDGPGVWHTWSASRPGGRGVAVSR